MDDIEKIEKAKKAREILDDMITKMEKARGLLSPFLCHDIGQSKCPDGDCWVQQVRSEQADILFMFERRMGSIRGSTSLDEARAHADEAIKEYREKLEGSPKGN